MCAHKYGCWCVLCSRVLTCSGVRRFSYLGCGGKVHVYGERRLHSCLFSVFFECVCVMGGGGLGGWLTPLSLILTPLTCVCVDTCVASCTFLEAAWSFALHMQGREHGRGGKPTYHVQAFFFFCPSARGNEYDGFNHKRNVCHESYLSSFHILSLFSPLKKTDFTFLANFRLLTQRVPKHF